METQTKMAGKNPFAVLQAAARPRRPVEACEFCNVVLDSEHRHLLELATRKIICACPPCALRFENVIGRWKLIPRDSRSLANFQMTDAQWEMLSLPIRLAFLFKSSAAHRAIAMYPSPAGATESLLPLSIWETLRAENPGLEKMESDVEALLVNRLSSSSRYYIAPLDVCFELVGLIRVHWRGLSGGDKVWQELETFFGRLNQQAVESGMPLVEACDEEVRLHA
jgi:hypothetical protein